MKGNYISAFPTLSNSLAEKCGIDPNSYSFVYSYYRDQDTPNVVLETESTNNLFLSLFDKSGSWSVDTHNLIIKGIYRIENPSVLFGSEGIAPSNTEIELCLRWGGTENKRRNVKRIGFIKNNTNLQEFEVYLMFPKNSIRGQVKLSYEYSIATSVTVSPEELHLANVKGTIVGEQQLSIIDIDSKDNSFPIDYINEPGEPLWKLKILDVDYMEKPFDSNYVLIQLNKAHPKFNCIDIVSRKREFEPALLNEVLASAICLMIEKIRTNKGKNLQQIIDEDQSSWTPGCIAEAIYNFQKEPMFFDYSDSVATSISIHKYFDKSLSAL